MESGLGTFHPSEPIGDKEADVRKLPFCQRPETAASSGRRQSRKRTFQAERSQWPSLCSQGKAVPVEAVDTALVQRQVDRIAMADTIVTETARRHLLAVLKPDVDEGVGAEALGDPGRAAKSALLTGDRECSGRTPIVSAWYLPAAAPPRKFIFGRSCRQYRRCTKSCHPSGIHDPLAAFCRGTVRCRRV